MYSDADYTVRRPADFDYSAAISDLEERVRRKKHLKSQLAHFEGEVPRLTNLTEARRFELAQETADVERMRKFSPAVLLYALTGQRETMLAREEAEALSAAALFAVIGFVAIQCEIAGDTCDKIAQRAGLLGRDGVPKRQIGVVYTFLGILAVGQYVVGDGLT